MHDLVLNTTSLVLRHRDQMIKMQTNICVCVCVSLQEKVRLRYKLAFTLGDHLCNEIGEVDQFPPPEMWGHL